MPWPSPSSVQLHRTRRTLLVLVAAGTAVFVWTVWAVLIFVILPSAVPSGKADAVVVLAGAQEERWPVATKLVTDRVAPRLLVSTVDAHNTQGPARPCVIAGSEGLDTRCFAPDPDNTRGEAMSVAQALKMGNWDSVVIVTSRYHAARTKILISQCTTASVEVVVSEPSLNFFQWMRVTIEETGGILDAFLRPQCKGQS